MCIKIIYMRERGWEFNSLEDGSVEIDCFAYSDAQPRCRYLLSEKNSQKLRARLLTVSSGTPSEMLSEKFENGRSFEEFCDDFGIEFEK